MTDNTKEKAELQALLQAESELPPWTGWQQDGFGAPSAHLWQQLLKMRNAADSLASVANDAKTRLPDEFLRSAANLQDAAQGYLDTARRDWLALTEALIERVYDRVSKIVLGHRMDDPDDVSKDVKIIH